MNPTDLSRKLTKIARKIENSKHPSKKLVAADITKLIHRLSTENNLLDDVAKLLVDGDYQNSFEKLKETWSDEVVDSISKEKSYFWDNIEDNFNSSYVEDVLFNKIIGHHEGGMLEKAIEKILTEQFKLNAENPEQYDEIHQKLENIYDGIRKNWITGGSIDEILDEGYKIISESKDEEEYQKHLERWKHTY